jgi:hypothetical protein
MQLISCDVFSLQVAPYERPALSKAYLFPQSKFFSIHISFSLWLPHPLHFVKPLIIHRLAPHADSVCLVYEQILQDYQDFMCVWEVEARGSCLNGTHRKVQFTSSPVFFLTIHDCVRFNLLNCFDYPCGRSFSCKNVCYMHLVTPMLACHAILCMAV